MIGGVAWWGCSRGMDGLICQPYVGRRMNLLLLLSALLSALTGVVSSVRVPEVSHAVAGSARVAGAAEARRPAATRRRVRGLPMLASLVAIPLSIVLPLRSREPLWANRRRE